jgi:Txe/YoeB family toxin of Txe-Axe toxin-antitoxin module
MTSRTPVITASEARANLYRLIGDMAGAYSRRINIQHRLA